MLKIYAKDDGYRGGRVVVAESLEEAIPLIVALDYLGIPVDPRDVTEHEITAGLKIVFLGDQ